MISFSSYLFYCSSLQYFLIMKPIKGLIEKDIANERKPTWERRDAAFRKRDLY